MPPCVQMLTVAICKIPICTRLFRLAHKLDEVRRNRTRGSCFLCPMSQPEHPLLFPIPLGYVQLIMS